MQKPLTLTAPWMYAYVFDSEKSLLHLLLSTAQGKAILQARHMHVRAEPSIDRCPDSETHLKS